MDRTKNKLPPIEDYASRQFLYSVDISSDYSSDSTWTTNPEDHGAVAMALHFSKPTPEQIAAILIAETVATLTIDADGDITLE